MATEARRAHALWIGRWWGWQRHTTRVPTVQYAVIVGSALAGPGAHSRLPCTRSQPADRSRRSCSVLLTRSATTRIPSAWASSTTARTIRVSASVDPDGSASEPSSFKMSAPTSVSTDSALAPVPKLSMAT